MENDEFEKAFQYSLRLLTIRRRTSQQLRDKLEDKGYSPELIRRVIKSLTEKELLNDEEFARTFLSEEVLKRPSGKLKLRYELKRRGIPGRLIEKLLEELGETYERDTAIKVAREKAESLKGLQPIKVKKRIYDYLARRGYDFQVCHDVLETLGESGDSEN